jgi:hypothetical protein
MQQEGQPGAGLFVVGLVRMLWPNFWRDWRCVITRQQQ